MDFKVALLFFMAAIFFVLWAVVLFLGRQKLVNNIYSIFVGSMTLWAFSLGMFYQSRDTIRALFWADVVYTAGSLISAGFLHFSYVFPGGRLSIAPGKQILIYIPVAVIVMFFFFTPLIVSDVFIEEKTRGFIFGAGHILWDLQFDLTFGLGFWRLVQSYRTAASNLTKLRLKYILWGTGSGLLLAGMTNVILPWFGRFEFMWLAPTLTSTWLVNIVYAIIRHRLLDIRVALSRTAIGAIIFGSLLSFPWLGSFLLQNFIIVDYRSFWWLLALGGDGLMILAFFAFRFYRYFQTGAERVLRKEEFYFHDILLRMSKEVTLIKDLDQLLETVVLRVVKDAGVLNASIYLKNEKGYLLRYGWGKEKEKFPQQIIQENILVEVLVKYEKPVLREEAAGAASIETQLKALQASLLVPCFVKKGELVGFLALGEKTSGQAYTQEDLEVFQTLSGYAALAIENAGYLKQLEALHVQALEAAKFRAIRQMINSMSHEIGNLLAPVVARAQMMLMFRKEKLDEELTKVFQEANERGMMAAEIIREVKDYYERSKKKEAIEFEIRQTIEKGLERLKENFAEIGVAAEERIEGDLGKIQANASFGDLFYHLLKNSWYNLKKYRRSGLWIEGKRNGNCAEVRIRDEGGSFERCLQEDTAGGELFTERGERGGVNLYLAKAIAQDHGIELKVESVGDGGGQFVVRIPD